MKMKNHDFILVNADTDSIMFCKADQTQFSEAEQEALLNEMKQLSGEGINWEHDGIYTNAVILKAKNYALKTPEGKIKFKGSSLKSATKEPAFREFMNAMLNSMLNGRTDLLDIYHKYVKECMNVTDINRYASKKTITEKVLNSLRSNETKVMDALGDTEYSPGDKRYFFYKEDGTLCLAELFDGTYDKIRLCTKLYNTLKTFQTVIDINMFLNYGLKRNKAALEELIK